jgi:hypothetical protein
MMVGVGFFLHLKINKGTFSLPYFPLGGGGCITCIQICGTETYTVWVLSLQYFIQYFALTFLYDIDNAGGLYWCFTDLSTVNYFISAIILKCD